MKRRRTSVFGKVFVYMSAALLGGASISVAGFTSIGRAPVSEHTHEQILESLYGGDFHRIDGSDFVNGRISARRVDDGLSSFSAMSMASGTVGHGADEMWTGSRFTARAVAKFSNNTQNLAINLGGATHTLFSAIGFGYDVSGSGAMDASGHGAYFERFGDSGRHSSVTSMNSDGRDHMITYEILGLAGADEKVWLTFWEDLNRTPTLASKRTHSDYNDLVVEMRATPVPLPAAAWAALAVGGLGAAFGKRLRRIAKV